MTTFQEAREKQAKKLDEIWDKLRSIVVQPDMCNSMFRDYVRAREELDQQLNVLIRLNNAYVEAKE